MQIRSYFQHLLKSYKTRVVDADKLQMQTGTCIFVIFNQLEQLKYITTYHYSFLSVNVTAVINLPVQSVNGFWLPY